jgi:hypothetical protein
MIWYHFQSQPDAIERLLDLLFLVLVTSPVSMAQLVIALAGGIAAHFLRHCESMGADPAR